MTNASEAVQKSNELFEAMPLLRKFISESQIQAMAAGAQGEEREYFIATMLEVGEHIQHYSKDVSAGREGQRSICLSALFSRWHGLVHY